MHRDLHWIQLAEGFVLWRILVNTAVWAVGNFLSSWGPSVWQEGLYSVEFETAKRSSFHLLTTAAALWEQRCLHVQRAPDSSDPRVQRTPDSSDVSVCSGRLTAAMSPCAADAWQQRSPCAADVWQQRCLCVTSLTLYYVLHALGHQIYGLYSRPNIDFLHRFFRFQLAAWRYSSNSWSRDQLTPHYICMRIWIYIPRIPTLKQKAC